MLLRLSCNTAEIEQGGNTNMARVKLSALMSDIRGKLNGSVFQSNNGILSLRRYSTPTNSKQPTAELNKIVSSVIQSAWLGLSDSDRAAWVQYAAVVKKSTKNSAFKFMSGQALFAHINFYQYVLNGTLFLNPVGYDNNTSARSYGLFVYGGNLFLSVDSTIDSNICYPFITLTHPVQPSRNHSPESGRKITYSAINGSLINITESYYQSFGFSLRPNDCVLLNSIMIDAVTGLTGYRNNQKLVVSGFAPYDQVSDNLVWAYSCRLLVSNYTGFLFTCIHSDGISTYDVTIDEWLNNFAGLDAWAGNDDCFITAIYNQLNNGQTLEFSVNHRPIWNTSLHSFQFDDGANGLFSNSLNFGVGESMATIFNIRYHSSYAGYLLGQVNRTLDNYYSLVQYDNNHMLLAYNACNFDLTTSAYSWGIRSNPANSFFNVSMQKRIEGGNSYIDSYINNDVSTTQSVKEVIGYFDSINDDGLNSDEGTRAIVRDIVALNTFLTDSQMSYINQFSNL